MDARALFTAFFVLAAGLLGVMSPASAQQSPPESEKSKQIVALVDKAAALIDSKGKAVFGEFRKAGSEWMSGDTYLFVGELSGVVLFNAAVPKLEGTNNPGLKESNGKLFAAEFTKVA